MPSFSPILTTLIFPGSNANHSATFGRITTVHFLPIINSSSASCSQTQSYKYLSSSNHDIIQFVLIFERLFILWTYEQSVGRVIVAYVIFGYTVAVEVISEVKHVAAVEYAHKPAAVIPVSAELYRITPITVLGGYSKNASGLF